MRYWWVNQNKTFDHEFRGGYLWSPKRKSNQARNPFYEFMREVSPGDIIFSFNKTRIPALGVAQSHCYEAPKPTEFGSSGINWSDIGWKVEVIYYDLKHKIRPADEMTILAPLLPDHYSPLQHTGRGQQSVYLALVPEPLANALIELIGHEARTLTSSRHITEVSPMEQAAPDIIRWEEHIAKTVVEARNIPETEREAVVMARRGQGLFKSNVRRIENRCRVTGVDKIEHLIASHCKPWRDCDTNQERLDGENGLLLTPSIDHLFDRGFISFEGDGRLLVSPVAHEASLRRMGIPVEERLNVGSFTDGQRRYLEFHRDYVFLAAKITH